MHQRPICSPASYPAAACACCHVKYATPVMYSMLIGTAPGLADRTHAGLHIVLWPKGHFIMLLLLACRDAHETANCGAYRRVYPSNDASLQAKYETVLQAAHGAFEMSILARGHRTVTKIQVRTLRCLKLSALLSLPSCTVSHQSGMD